MCQFTNKTEKDDDGESKKNNTDDQERLHIKGRVVTQILACVSASLGNLSGSMVTGWPASIVPLLQEDPDMNVNIAEVAWIASIVAVGSLIGSVFAGRAMDWLGRRTLLMVIAPLLSAGWVIIALAPNIEIILLGRIICGISNAFLFSTTAVYCSEICEARIRGRLGAIPALFHTIGLLLIYTVGAFFSWRMTCYICIVPILLMFIALCTVSESPYWYLLKGNNEKCKSSLRWLRGPSYDFTAEMFEMESKINSVGRKVEYQEFLKPSTRKPFLISLFMNTCQQLSGGTIFVIYNGMIFISAGVSNYRWASISTGLIQFVFTLLCMFMVDRVGRRPLFLASISIMSISVTFLGCYYLLNNVLGISWPVWIPLVAVMVSVAGYFFGLITVTSIYSTELFNTTVRSTAQTIIFFYNRILHLTILQVYAFFEEAFGTHTVFLTFGILNFLSTLVSYFVVPETKGKTLEEIQDGFESERIRKRNVVQPVTEIPSVANGST